MKKVSKLNNVITHFLPTVPQMEHSILAKIAKKFRKKWVKSAYQIRSFFSNYYQVTALQEILITESNRYYSKIIMVKW